MDFFWKIVTNILMRNVSGKDDPCCKSNKSIASSRRMKFPMTKLLWTYLVIGGASGAKTASSQSKCHQQWWSLRGRPWPRGHILKSLALAAKPHVLENCPARTALFFEQLRFCWKTPETSQKTLQRPFLFSSFGNRLKKIFEDLFLENTCACAFGLGLELSCLWTSRGSVWGKAVLGLGFFCVLGVSLEHCVLDSTSGHQW